MTRNATGPTQVFRVNVPPGVHPGTEFQVYAGTRVVRVRCPPDSRPGQSLQITIPPDPVVTQNLLGMAPLTAGEGAGGGGAVPMNGQTVAVNRNALERDESGRSLSDSPGGNDPAEEASSHHAPPPPPHQPAAYMVTVPPNVRPGMQFPVSVNAQQLMVTCPPNARPGVSVRIVPPPPPVQGTSLDRPPEPRQQAPSSSGNASNQTVTRTITTQMFEVVVPPGVRPGQPFTLIAGGQRVLVTCPNNAVPGQKIRFQLPVARQPSKTKLIESVKLSYDGDAGWSRTIRVTDMKFQWIRVDESGSHAGGVDISKGFDIKHSAYVRKLSFLEGNDSRMRTGVLSLVPAGEAAVDSRIVVNNRDLVSYADIADAQGKTFDGKTAWFQETCSRLTSDWDDGHMRINVRRSSLLHDSVDAVMSLGREDLRKIWRFEFIGEMGIDAGGLAREWFQLVTEQIFDPDRGLWLSGSGNQMCMRVNPASEVSCPEDHLIYFRFLGRVIGKALFDRQLVSGHMARHMYKHILGWPITFDDLELADEEYYKSLKQLTEIDDVSLMCLDFTVTEETLGVKKEIELIPGGSDVEVTNENLPEYLEANLKYRMLDRIKPQLTELLLGFFDVIPEPLLTVFDFQELELLTCGLPEIDLDDWTRNTLYSGSFQRAGGKHQVCRWFWQVVREEFDRETQARLLQFVTGTSGVPSRGFSVLQGSDGNIRKFTIHGVEPGTLLYPRAHTCFNRIDLPLYKSKHDLHEKLKLAVTMLATGFDIE